MRIHRPVAREEMLSHLNSKVKLRPGCIISQREAAMASAGPDKEFCDGTATICSFCLERCGNPVILDCGHCLCQVCSAHTNPDIPCPHCGDRFQQGTKVNKTAKEHQESNRTKEKSRICQKHQEPLTLFCKDDQVSICLVCDKAKEHKNHHTIPRDEAVQEYKGLIYAQLKPLEKKRQVVVDRKLAEELRSKECMNELEDEIQKLKQTFVQMHQLLGRIEHLRLAQLEDLRHMMEKQQDGNSFRLSEKVSHYTKLITERKEKCQQPAGMFLEDIKNTLNRYEKEQEEHDAVDLFLGLKDVLLIYSEKNSTLEKSMENFKESLEVLEPRLYKVNVTLDPDTAHPRLILSQDLKNVRKGDMEQKLPDTSKRFDVRPCVLGRERFTSGRHWWEVEVELDVADEDPVSGREAMWALGVAGESLRRKGKFSFRLNPNERIWAVGMISGEVVAFTSPERTPVALRHEIRKIRVSLDYDKGLVEFFDADTSDWIFTFSPATFLGENIYPYFWVGYRSRLKC